MKEKLEEALSNAKGSFESLQTETNKLLEKGNKASASRARKSALELQKSMKEVRTLITEYKNSL